MIEVTERAAQLLKEIRIRVQGASDEGRGGKVLRLVHSEGSFGFGLDFPREGDHVIQSEGMDILLVDPDLAETLERVTIDFQDTPKGPS
ncbi:MAG: hypothetical protein GTO63_04305, partial [Anaerolineae bacterium]|nr:hypothetical protein [Anaerolineae bacterium]NIN94230.1 hypothetical protein [Anaerolineae bacterium]NIQ77288.1 hypothetical protein [Anaerolineae bacterium]